MTATKIYQLTKKEYIGIVLNTLRKNVLKLIPFLLIWSLLLGWYVGSFLVIYSIIALLFVSIVLLCWFSIKNLKPFFTETTLQFDDELLQVSKNNGTIQWHFNRLKKVVEEKKYWLIYLTNVQYVYVPKHIFLHEGDQKRFRSLLKI